MPSSPRTARPAARPLLAASLGLAVAVTGLSVLAAAPAQAVSTSLVISEVYGGGGNSGATYTHDFIELYNPTSAPIAVGGLSVQWRSAGNTGVASGVTPLTGTVPAQGHFLVQEAAGSGGNTALPNPDVIGAIAMGASGGTAMLVTGTTAVDPATGAFTQTAPVIDLVGTSSNVFETTTATGMGNTASVSRTAGGTDTDVNATDLTGGAPSPVGTVPPVPPVDFTGTIAEIQGTTATSPRAGENATTRGVVTAAYPTGGLNGFYLQTGGTGGADATPGASDAIFVYGGTVGFATYPAIGASVEVEGLVSEFSGTTEITADRVDPVTALAPVTPLVTAYPTTEAAREAHEGELLTPTDKLTVTNTFSTNQYAEIGLATGTKPLIQPTDVARVGTPALDAVKADNAARAVTLDDAATTNFLSTANGGAAKNIALPWLSKANPIRVGAPVSLTAPVILEYRNSVWKFQPRGQVTGDGAGVATFANTRTTAPDKVGGDLELATFNVLNYFNTTGVDFAAGGAGRACTYFTDRQGNNVTDNNCTPNGPRGAAEADDLKRQQDKIVAAINALGADVVSLEEIENSVAIGETDRDDALRTLVAALNAAAGKARWAFAPSPPASELPPVASQDVIRTAFIYDPSTVKLVGASDVLTDAPAFANAREPLAQAFKRTGSSDRRAFAVVVNHFKSKGDSTPPATGDNANGEQGAFSGDRVRQANALTAFAKAFAKSRKTRKVFLTGDFNSYTQEDPMQALYGAGFTNIASATPGESTYSFSGLSGSIDHVLANKQALRMVTGSDVWSINSGESVAFEYSRFNYNVTDFYEPNAFRASDHDPELVGLRTQKVKPSVTVSRKPRGQVGVGARVRLVVQVKASGERASGFVTIKAPGHHAVRVKLKKGRVVVRLPRFGQAGTKVVKVTYNGRGEIQKKTKRVVVKVTRRS